jgi:hypothetical protein
MRTPGQRSGASEGTPRSENLAAAQPLDLEPKRTPLEVVERACDATFLHLVEAGCVGTHPDDLVTATLRQIMREAHALHEDASPARRWWAT